MIYIASVQFKGASPRYPEEPDIRFGLLRCEARQIIVNLRGRSVDPSRIVQARLPICTAIVTQFVTHFWCDVVTRSQARANRWSSDLTPSDAPAWSNSWRG